MEYPKPALQPPGSEDCEFYATAYLAGLFGHTVNPDAVKEYLETERITGCGYLMDKLQMRPAWTFPGLTGGQGYKLAYSHQSGYRKWVEAHLEAGFVGLAVIQLIPRAQHAVVFLSADDGGVLLADSCRGLVRDSWSDILTTKQGHSPGRVDAWFYLGECV